MKLHTVVPAILLLFLVSSLAPGQAGKPKELREYTSPDALVSIAPTTTLDRALSAISEVSKKFTGKVIVDTEHREFPINVDIQGMFWRDALEQICRKNNIWYTEYENYIQITGSQQSDQTNASGANTTGSAPRSTEIQKEAANFHSREIKISAVFFEVDLTKLDEVGINWNFMKSTKDVDVNASFTGADIVKNNVFKTEVTPKVSFANIDLIAKIFSNYNLGQILSSPSIIVRSGEEGKIQVGQDFSIRERDFAGNLIDKFYSAGTIINVRPQVISEQGVNFVHMVAEAERSNVVPGQLSTIINKTKANTNLLLLDGEETIIGGLYSTESTTIRTGIPFLKDLPWYIFGLRYLFGYDSEEFKKQELIILLKAELVPTLQERITQRAKEGTEFERWREEKAQLEKRVKGNGE
jgi:general secretion pathway protein D